MASAVFIIESWGTYASSAVPSILSVGSVSTVDGAKSQIKGFAPDTNVKKIQGGWTGLGGSVTDQVLFKTPDLEAETIIDIFLTNLSDLKSNNGMFTVQLQSSLQVGSTSTFSKFSIVNPTDTGTIGTGKINFTGTLNISVPDTAVGCIWIRLYNPIAISGDQLSLAVNDRNGSKESISCLIQAAVLYPFGSMLRPPVVTKKNKKKIILIAAIAGSLFVLLIGGFLIGFAIKKKTPSETPTLKL